MKYVSLAAIAPQPVSHDPQIQKQVMLQRGDAPHLTNFSQACLKPGQAVTEHLHPDMGEVFFVQSGQGTLEVMGKPYSLSPGTCVLVEPGERHRLINTTDCDLVVIYLGIEWPS
jgi:quercetin dioxygenase-like cupin family protein